MDSIRMIREVQRRLEKVEDDKDKKVQICLSNGDFLVGEILFAEPNMIEVMQEFKGGEKRYRLVNPSAVTDIMMPMGWKPEDPA